MILVHLSSPNCKMTIIMSVAHIIEKITRLTDETHSGWCLAHNGFYRHASSVIFLGLTGQMLSIDSPLSP